VPIIATTPIVGGSRPTEAAIPVIPVVGSSEVDFTGTEGYSLLQKGLFFGVILGCMMVYMRMSRKRGRGYEEKSLA